MAKAKTKASRRSWGATFRRGAHVQCRRRQYKSSSKVLRPCCVANTSAPNTQITIATSNTYRANGALPPSSEICGAATTTRPGVLLPPSSLPPPTHRRTDSTSGLRQTQLHRAHLCRKLHRLAHLRRPGTSRHRGCSPSTRSQAAAYR